MLTGILATMTPTLPKKSTLHIQEAAAYLGVSRFTIYRLIDAGELTAYRIRLQGRGLRIRTEDLESYLETHQVDPGQ